MMKKQGKVSFHVGGIRNGFRGEKNGFSEDEEKVKTGGKQV